MAPRADPKTRWESIRGWLVGLTGVVVVVPALINAGIDVYRTAQNVPRTDAERVNVSLFSKYFNKQPKAKLPPVQITHNGATYDVEFSVYDEGDLYVRYGRVTHWFPFPEASLTTASVDFSPISSAYAQDRPAIQPSGPYRQQDSLKGQFLIRRLSYSNGATEDFTIDTRTGTIVNKSSTPPTIRVPVQPQRIPVTAINLDRSTITTIGR